MKESISARKVIVISVMGTYCIAVLGSLALVIMKIIDVAVFLGIFASLSTLVLAISNSYFERKDRKNGGGNA